MGNAAHLAGAYPGKDAPNEVDSLTIPSFSNSDLNTQVV